MTGYTTRDVSNLLALTPRQIRSFARSGVLSPERGPHGEYQFSFQDLVLLRTAASLLQARVPHRRVLAALTKLRAELPADRSITEVQLVVEGDVILVRDRSTTWDPVSAQFVLDFSVAELAADVAALDRERDAESWYRRALELEATNPGEASVAYEQVLEVAPDHADAHVNLGRLLCEEGRCEEAAAHYRAALATGAHAVAAYNLGIVLEDLKRPAEAIAAYRRALAADDTLAEAHYNLARLCESRGDGATALRHYRAYRDLTA